MENGRLLMVAAAGTGGHVMPGLAVAGELAGRGWSVTWLGTETGMESGLVGKRGIPFDGLDFQGLRGKGAKTALLGGFKLVASIFRARALMKAKRPAAVFSTGGYIAVPAAVAAWSLGIPFSVMNCDAQALLSVKMVQPFARKVLCGFEGEAARRAGAKAVVTGNPVREAIRGLPDPARRYEGRGGRLRLLVFGGSLGARILNETVPQALALIPEETRPEVVHQSGKGAGERVADRYSSTGVEARVVEFIDDMASLYDWCDVVVCRAGATTVSELSAAGVAAILVPFRAKTTSHQTGNAAFMEKAGAAIHMPQREMTAEGLAEVLQGLDRKRLAAMAAQARAIGRRDAAGLAADEIEKTVA